MMDGKLLCEAAWPDSGVTEEASLLVCDDVSLGEQFPVFRRSQCLHLRGQTTWKSGTARTKTRCHISENLRLQKVTYLCNAWLLVTLNSTHFPHTQHNCSVVIKGFNNAELTA